MSQGLTSVVLPCHGDQRPNRESFMIRIALPIIALVLSGPAFAQDEAVETVASVPTAPPAVSSALTLTLQSNTPMEQNATLYQCDDNTTLSVQYINAAPNFLALVPVDG